MPRTAIEPEERRCLRCGMRFLVGGRGRPRKHVRYCSLGCANLSQRREGSFKAPPARSMSEVEAAWFAGVFDGEGSIVFVKRSRLGETVRMSVTNTCLPLLQEVQRVAGTGAIIVQRRFDPERPQHAPSWMWTCYSRNTQSLLRQMRPWLIAKAEKADRALALHIP